LPDDSGPFLPDEEDWGELGLPDDDPFSTDGPVVSGKGIDPGAIVNKGERKPGFYTVLLIGIDEYNNTDTLMVASIDSVNKKASLISIPRDSLVDVSRGMKKINAAYANGGIDQLRTEVASLIGFKPDYYAIVELKGFKRLVDAVKGVDFDVPQDMYYHDPTQNLLINLKKGMQTLNGDKAVQLVRFRRYKGGDDFKRTEVQRDFLVALAKKAMTLEGLFNIGEIADIINDNVKTGLQLTDIAWFVTQLFGIDFENNVTLAGLPWKSAGPYKGKGDYVFIDAEKTIELVNETVNPFIKPITLKNVHIIGP